MKLPDKIYDILKWAAIIALPASATFVRAVFPIWNIPNAEEISATITSVATLVGALLCVSSANYSKEK